MRGLKKWIVEWYHRHVCADDAASAECDRIDQELDERMGRLRQSTPRGILHGDAEGYMEQMKEARR
jgi:hypothetical protein